jgi:23S rRNA pseudouridine1911/1915/1917 synthase
MDVLYEDAHLIVLDKPHGQHSQGTARGDEGSVIAEARALYGDGVRLVHRLDRDASGLLVVARGKKATARLSEGFRDHSIRRTYAAQVSIPLAVGTTGSIDASLRWAGGRCWVDRNGAHAVTHYEVTARNPPLTTLQLQLETGRMHQIRVHCAHALGPIVGDRKYGGVRGTHLMLRAIRLEFQHPITDKAMRFEVPLNFPDSA